MFIYGQMFVKLMEKNEIDEDYNLCAALFDRYTWNPVSSQLLISKTLAFAASNISIIRFVKFKFLKRGEKTVLCGTL